MATRAEIKKLKKDLKWYRIGWIGGVIGNIIFICMLGFVLTSVYFLNGYHKDVTVDYSQLNQSERAVAYHIIDELKPEYFHLVWNISFVKDILPWCDDCVGINERGNVHVLWDSDEQATKDILCHEIIHSLTGFRNRDNEFFAYDLMNYGVCFKYEY